jgi:ChpA-C
MRQVARKGLATAMATGGMLAAATGVAHADAGAAGSAVGSAGVGSGNNVQVPVHVPVNICGNTVDVIGVLNPAIGNRCANISTGNGGGAGAGAVGTAQGSPGVLSGNNVQVPVDIPVNVCGNTVDVVGLLNPATGNNCANASTPGTPPPTAPGNPGRPPGSPTPSRPGTHQPSQPGRVDPTPSAAGHSSPAGHQPQASSEKDDQLAQTGAGALGVTLPIGAVLLGSGILIYRKAKPASRRA